MKQKLFSLCLALVIVALLFNYSSASEFKLSAETDITPMWTLIGVARNDFTITSGGQAQMSARITAFSGVEKVIMSSYLQRQENNTWVSLGNWAHEQNGTTAFWSHSINVSSGYNYRLRTFFYAYDGTDWEVITITTNNVYY